MTLEEISAIIAGLMVLILIIQSKQRLKRFILRGFSR